MRGTAVLARADLLGGTWKESNLYAEATGLQPVVASHATVTFRVFSRAPEAETRKAASGSQGGLRGE